MSFSKPLSVEEQKFILRNRHRMTRGQIATELAKQFAEHNGGDRSPDGVSDFIRRYESESTDASFRLQRRHQEKFSELRLDKIDVDFIISACFDHAITVLENGKHPPKPAKNRGRATGK
jgi:hypothetical protein